MPKKGKIVTEKRTRNRDEKTEKFGVLYATKTGHKTEDKTEGKLEANSGVNYEAKQDQKTGLKICKNRACFEEYEYALFLPFWSRMMPF